VIDAFDSAGAPLGQAHESKTLPDLLRGLRLGAVVPSSPSRSRRLPHDRHLYRERNLFRRVATRYDKNRRELPRLHHTRRLHRPVEVNVNAP
jgi:hypothetical protein